MVVSSIARLVVPPFHQGFFFSAACLTPLIELCRRVMERISDPCRPELHYMRGPGPKWREKHAGKPSASAIDPQR
jgi:hypothetical protein